MSIGAYYSQNNDKIIWQSVLYFYAYNKTFLNYGDTWPHFMA